MHGSAGRSPHAGLVRRILTSGGTTKQFITRFRREGAGEWVCLQPAELRLPQGRIQVTPGTRFTLGTKFMNVEIAALLDEQYDKGRDPGSTQ